MNPLETHLNTNQPFRDKIKKQRAINDILKTSPITDDVSDTIYERENKNKYSRNKKLNSSRLDQDFRIQNTLPLGMALAKETNSFSLESYLEWLVNDEWRGNLPVNQYEPGQPYNYILLAELYARLANVYSVGSGGKAKFIQFNNKHEWRYISNIKNYMNNLFVYMDIELEKKNARPLPKIFHKVFNTHFWKSDDVRFNKLLPKKFQYSDDKFWMIWPQHIDLDETIILNKIGRKYDTDNKTYRYCHKRYKFEFEEIKVYNENHIRFKDNVVKLIKEVLSTNGILTNQQIYDSFKLNDKFIFVDGEKDSKQTMRIKFTECVNKMCISLTPHRDGSGRGYKVTKVEHKITSIEEETE